MKWRSNLNKLMVLLATVGLKHTTATAQNKILDGQYISNVYGPSNFVKNPNAQLNTSNVTVSNATVSRSTTTPLMAGSEFNVTVTSANGTITWATRTFDAGLKGQSCEARFQYRGFQATSIAKVLQSTNVVGQLTLIPNSTNVQTASIVFPCGDLSTSTTFQITDTSTLAGTNEIGAIYVGLATNQANISQATLFGALQYNNIANCSWTNTGTYSSPAVFAADTDCSTPTVTAFASAPATKIPGMTFAGGLPIGFYMFCAQGDLEAQTTSTTSVTGAWRFSNGTNNGSLSSTLSQGASGNIQLGVGGFCSYLNVSTAIAGPTTFQIYGGSSGSSAQIDARNVPLDMQVYRYPSNSEIAVTPSTQNVYGAGQFNTGNADVDVTSSSKTVLNGSAFGSPTLFGSATTPASSCGLTTNDFGICVPVVPPGDYQVIAGGAFRAITGAAGTQTNCFWDVYDGTNILGTATTNAGPDATNSSLDAVSAVIGIVRYTSTQTNKRFVVRAARSSGSGNCRVTIDPTSNVQSYASITLRPLNQSGNQALYVQGPVKAAETGTTIASGYQGYKVEITQSSFTNFPTSTQWGDFNSSSITLTPGCWNITFLVQARDNSATVANWAIGISTTTGNSSSGLLDGINVTNFVTSSGGNRSTASIPNYIQCVSSSTVYYGKVSSQYSVATPQYTGRLTAILMN